MSDSYSQNAYDTILQVIKASAEPLTVKRIAALSGYGKPTVLIVVRVMTAAESRVVRISYRREKVDAGRAVRHFDTRIDLPDEARPPRMTAREISKRHAERRARDPVREAKRRDIGNYGAVISRSIMLSYLQAHETAGGAPLSCANLAAALGVSISAANRSIRGLVAAGKIRIADWIVRQVGRPAAKFDTQVDLPSVKRPPATPRGERRKARRDAIIADPIAGARLRAKQSNYERDRRSRQAPERVAEPPAFDWKNALNNWGKSA